MKHVIITFLFLMISINAQQELTQNPEKDSKFLEIQVDNPELQSEIDNLKIEYDSELNKIKEEFKIKKKSLRKLYKGKLKEIRKKYKIKKSKKKKIK